MTPDASTAGASSGFGKVLLLWLGGTATGAVLLGAAVLYVPGLDEKLKSLRGGAGDGAAVAEVERKGFEMGTIAPGEAVRRIAVTLSVGKGGKDLAEPVDLHLGTGFPLRLYPLGSNSREPAFAAFPQKSNLPDGKNAITAGESATFEFSVSGERGADALNTTPQLLADLEAGDLRTIGFASRGQSDWVLAGYRIEVNGKLLAANDSVDRRPAETVAGTRAELQAEIPAIEGLAKAVADLETYVGSGLASDADKASLAAKREELAKVAGPMTGLVGQVTGSHPWYVEEDPGFAAARAGGRFVRSVKVTVATGGGERPGSRNPVYLWAEGRKYLLSSENDPLADEAAPQVFEIAAADLEISPLTRNDLTNVGIGMVGNEERFGEAPDRARVQRVVVEADGLEVFDSEKVAGDRSALAGFWLLPPAHFDAAGKIVENAATAGEVYLWKTGMVAPEVPAPVTNEAEPPPPVTTADAIPPPPLRAPLGGILEPPFRRTTGDPFRLPFFRTFVPRPNPLATILASLLVPIPAPGPLGAIISPARIAPGQAIIRPGDAVTVQWNVIGSPAGVTFYQVDLFAVLPHRPVPQVGVAPLVRVLVPPTGAALESTTVTLPNPLPALPGVSAVESTQLYFWPVVTAMGAGGFPISAIGRPGSMLPLFPAGTNPPGVVGSPAAFNFGRGSFFPPLPSAAPPSFQFVSLAPAPPVPWSVMGTTPPAPAAIASWSPLGEQPSSNAVVFDTYETFLTPAAGFAAYNTAVRPGANQITVNFEGSVPYPSTASGAAAALNGYRVVGHVGYIGSGVPGATVNVLARVELNAAAPIPRDLADNVTDVTIPPVLPGFGPFFTYQTAAPIVVTKVPGAPLTLIDMPLRFNLLDGGPAAVAGYPAPGVVAGRPTGSAGGAFAAADYAAYNLTKATGSVGVTVTLMIQTLAGGGPGDAVGIFGMRIVPDTSP